MNIQCEWRGNELLIRSYGKIIASVSSLYDATSDPSLTFYYGVIPTLTFSEMEHIMDNWHNMPKEPLPMSHGSING